jgi:hypothetical protein
VCQHLGIPYHACFPVCVDAALKIYVCVDDLPLQLLDDLRVQRGAAPVLFPERPVGQLAEVGGVVCYADGLEAVEGLGDVGDGLVGYPFSGFRVSR